MTGPTPASPSPKWGSLTKMVIGLTIIAVVAGLVVQFRAIIGPLLLAFILTYLLYPVIDMVSKVSRLSWRASANLLFLLVVIIYLGLITATGLTVVQQILSLTNFVRQQVTNLPALVEDLSTQQFQFGRFVFSLEQYDLGTLTQQVLSTVQPLLGRIGSLVSTFATSAAATLGWSFFVLLISYFLLVDADRFPGQLLPVEVPGYEYDIRRLGSELRKIWNAYLRGQLLVILLVMIAYSILMLTLGIHFAVGIAIMAGLARFVPYIGPLTTAVVTFLVAFFQGQNYFGLPPYQFAILVVVAAFILDQIFDNLISPRLLGQALGVHPAGVLIAAIIAANLIGLIGLVLAAPVLATLRLLSRYITRKMFDLDPWPEPDLRPPTSPLEVPWRRWWARLRAWGRTLQRR